MSVAELAYLTNGGVAAGAKAAGELLANLQLALGGNGGCGQCLRSKGGGRGGSSATTGEGDLTHRSNTLPFKSAILYLSVGVHDEKLHTVDVAAKHPIHGV